MVESNSKPFPDLNLSEEQLDAIFEKAKSAIPQVQKTQKNNQYTKAFTGLDFALWN